MPELMLEKSGLGFMPANEESEQLATKIASGQTIEVSFRKVRNIKFHRKAMALFNWAYEHWEPPKFEDTRWKGVVPEKNFDRFRKDLTILAGHHEAFYRMDGTIRIEAKSLSFDKMDELEFSQVYSDIINAILRNMFKGLDKESILKLEQQLLSFC